MTHKMIKHDAMELAGAFYELNRTDVFRKLNPNQDAYVRKEWPHFVEDVRNAYVACLSDPRTTELMKEKCADALIADNAASLQSNAVDVLQINKGTEAFQGSKYQNRDTERMIGEHGLRAALLGTASQRFH